MKTILIVVGILALVIGLGWVVYKVTKAFSR